MRTSHLINSYALHFSVFLVLFLLNAFGSYGQLSDAETSIHVDSTVLQLNDSVQFPANALHVSITPDNVDDLGTVYIAVYDGNGLLVWPEIIATKDQCLTHAWLQENQLVIPAAPFTNDASYKITVSLTNSDGLFIYNAEISYPL